LGAETGVGWRQSGSYGQDRIGKKFAFASIKNDALGKKRSKSVKKVLKKVKKGVKRVRNVAKEALFEYFLRRPLLF